MDVVGLVSGTIGERNLHVVMVEDKSLDEEISVRLVDGHQDHSAV